ncbi:MAG: hypothetical protein NE334_20455 [Lentisphaeraceae bacterium]|nr:hypothetical protein [Lentisphaeraceae bacterium]
MMKNRKLKLELMKLFLRKDFLELKDKKAALKACFLDDLKWAISYLFLMLTSVILILLFR